VAQVVPAAIRLQSRRSDGRQRSRSHAPNAFQKPIQ
jgi:hypothetical protein